MSRLPLNWVLPWVAAGVLAGTLALATYTDVLLWLSAKARGIIAAKAVPVFWLLVAGGLSRRDHTAGRHAVTAAALIVTAILLVECVDAALQVAVMAPAPLPFWLRDGLRRHHWITGPVVLTALVPATAGWWERRRERLAEGD